MSPSSRVRAGAATCAVLAVGALVVGGGGAAGAASPGARPSFGANAFGSLVHVGSLANSGKTAHVPLCTRRVGVGRGDHTAATNLPGIGTIGAVTTHVASLHPGGVRRSKALTHTARTNLFAGQLRARAVASHAAATRKGAKTVLAGGATFVGLTIAGQSVPASAPAGSTYTLPGIGKVELNAQQRLRRFGNPTIIVTAMRVTIGAHNAAGLPTGTIVIGRSAASLHNPTHHRVLGTAYGTKVTLANGTARSGRTAPVYLPCGGTAGQTKTRNATARVVLPNALHTGEIASHARSQDTRTRTSVLTTNHIAAVTVFGGALQARGITTHAYAARTAGRLVRKSSGTSLGSLTINGQAQKLTRKPNQKYTIPGIARVWVHRVQRTGNGVKVFALQIVLTKAQDGLDAGTMITIGAASAGVTRR